MLFATNRLNIIVSSFLFAPPFRYIYITCANLALEMDKQSNLSGNGRLWETQVVLYELVDYTSRVVLHVSSLDKLCVYLWMTLGWK